MGILEVFRCSLHRGGITGYTLWFLTHVFVLNWDAPPYVLTVLTKNSNYIVCIYKHTQMHRIFIHKQTYRHPYLRPHVITWSEAKHTFSFPVWRSLFQGELINHSDISRTSRTYKEQNQQMLDENISFKLHWEQHASHQFKRKVIMTGVWCSLPQNLEDSHFANPKFQFPSF